MNELILPQFRHAHAQTYQIYASKGTAAQD